MKLRPIAWALVGLGAAILLWGSVCVVPQPTVYFPLRAEFAKLEFPPGGDVQYADVRATPLIAYDGTDYASSLIHYQDREDAFALANDTRALLREDGWTVTGEGRYVSATRGDGWRLNVETGRWTEEGRGCCVETRDPAHPVALLVHLFPG